jgi:hypothetical protein
MSNSCDSDVFGASPANIKWNVVRGDTATIQVDFYNSDESSAYDTTDWTYLATAYDPKTETYHTLDVEENGNGVKIIASSSVTELWGTGINAVVAQLKFDLQVTLADLSVWTPLVGTIKVIGDVTGLSDDIS